MCVCKWWYVFLCTCVHSHHDYRLGVSVSGFAIPVVAFASGISRRPKGGAMESALVCADSLDDVSTLTVPVVVMVESTVLIRGGGVSVVISAGAAVRTTALAGRAVFAAAVMTVEPIVVASDGAAIAVEAAPVIGSAEVIGDIGAVGIALAFAGAALVVAMKYVSRIISKGVAKTQNKTKQKNKIVTTTSPYRKNTQQKEQKCLSLPDLEQ